MLFVCHREILREHCLQFLLVVKMAPRETENNAYAKFWGDKQRALWYVIVFSGVVNCFSVHVISRLKITSRSFRPLKYFIPPLLTSFLRVDMQPLGFSRKNVCTS